jgi:hypothetical protein
MAKITRPKLSKGTKLGVQHWNQPMAAVAGLLNNATIDSENLELNNTNFSITYNWPRLPSYAFEYQTDGEDPSQLVTPFILPPLQDSWSSGLVGDETPMPILRSMSISFDTGMGPNGVNDAWDGNIDATDKSAQYTDADADIYNVNVEIRAKQQSVKYGSNADVVYNVPKETIFKTQISSLLFSGESQRFNPLFIDGIDVVLSPFKTYVLYINFPDINTGKTTSATRRQFAVSSLTTKLNFEGPVLARDQYDSVENPIQNIPTFADGGFAGSSITLDTAVSPSFITARTGVSGNGRIQRNAETIDSVLQFGTLAGRDIKGGQPVTESLSVAAGYSVIAVPMFGGWGDIRSEDINTIGLPYGPIIDSAEAAPWSGGLVDRRIIPIVQPFVIHNIFAVHSYYSHAVAASLYPDYDETPRNGGAWSASSVPSSNTLISSIGVGISTGLRSDDKEYEQIAFAAMSPGDKTDYLVDRIKTGQIAPYWGSAVQGNYDIEIFQIPLVQNNSGGAGTRSYYDQGFPYYVGRSDMLTKARKSVGVVGGGTRTPNTEGGEQFIEVRWKIEDSAGLNVGAGANADGTCYVGMGGLWVYIIGKIEMATTTTTPSKI